MKKSILTSVVLLLALGSAMAQQTEISKIQHSVSSDVPMEVLAAVESDYPGMNIREHLPASPITLENEMIRHIQPKNISELHAVYFAEITGRDYRKTANYNKAGKLISSTEKIRNIAVPRAVLTTIGREYNGWLVTKNQATRFISATNKSVFYEVWLKKGKKKQQITMDATGKILKKKRP